MVDSNSMFQGKTILVISPEPWGEIKLSKHHYAIELAKRCKQVFFLVHPDDHLTGEWVQKERLPVEGNLFLVRSRLIVPFSQRFNLKRLGLFNAVMYYHAKRLINDLGTVDVVWSFNISSMYKNLKWFGAPLKIFHPMDQLDLKTKKILESSCDIVLSVSENILKGFSDDVPKEFIHHGLAPSFSNIAQMRKKSIQYGFGKTGAKEGEISVGYVGNLMIGPVLDKGLIQKIILQHAGVDFHFWGPSGDSLLGVCEDKETFSFIDFLKRQDNVILHGVKTPEVLAEEIMSMDAFLLCYNNKEDRNQGSNSHKILEYLSMGNVVISSRISTYDKMPDLLEMPKEDDNKSLTNIFDEVMKNLAIYNQSDRCISRIDFALDNTYSKQIDKIELLLTRHNLG